MTKINDDTMTKDGELKPRMAVVSAIKEWILQGELLPGAAIPPERALSQRLQVQRPTIRRALKILEREGIVQTLGPRTRIVAERKHAMEHSVVVVTGPISDLGEIKAMGLWATSMIRSVIDMVGVSGYHLMMANPGRGEENNIQQFIAGKPSGVIIPEIVSGLDRCVHLQWSKALRKAGIPIAVYGGDPELQGLDRVTSDHETGAYELTRVMLRRGCKRILMLFQGNVSDIYWVQGRRRGYEKALREAGLTPMPMVYSSPFVTPVIDVTPERFEVERRHIASYLLEYLGPLAGANAIDGLMVASDGDIAPAAGACRLLGAVPGRDVHLVGYDNYWSVSWEQRYEPAVPLATVDKHNEAIGRELVALLLDRIEGRLPEEGQMRVVPPQLIVPDESKSK